MNWTRTSDMAAAPSVIGGVGFLLRSRSRSVVVAAGTGAMRVSAPERSSCLMPLMTPNAHHVAALHRGVQQLAAVAERLRRPRVRTGDEAVERHRDVVDQLCHGVQHGGDRGRINRRSL